MYHYMLILLYSLKNNKKIAIYQETMYKKNMPSIVMFDKKNEKINRVTFENWTIILLSKIKYLKVNL